MWLVVRRIGCLIRRTRRSYWAWCGGVWCPSLRLLPGVGQDGVEQIGDDCDGLSGRAVEASEDGRKAGGEWSAALDRAGVFVNDPLSQENRVLIGVAQGCQVFGGSLAEHPQGGATGCSTGVTGTFLEFGIEGEKVGGARAVAENIAGAEGSGGELVSVCPRGAVVEKRPNQCFAVAYFAPSPYRADCVQVFREGLYFGISASIEHFGYPGIGSACGAVLHGGDGEFIAHF